MIIKKQYKPNFRFYFLLFLIVLFLIFVISGGLYFLVTTKTERDLKKLQYNKEAISLIIDKKLDKYLINNNLYSKTLEVALVNNLYEDNLLEEYLYFSYKDYDNYIEQLNELNIIGYQRSDIEQVFKILSEEEINTIINKKTMIDNLASYINNDYFNINAIDRYIDYKKINDSYDYDKVISHVNMLLDYPHYEHTIDVTKPNDLLVIVNKYYKLSKDFVPKDLVRIDTKYAVDNDRWVIPVVKENFEKMASDMRKLGLTIQAKSAYRSYQTQVILYDNYVKASGKTAADTFSARAGYSEHQTGLAVDVRAGTGNYGTFAQSDEHDWMAKNAHTYGFILRYPENKTNITGYKFESWHFRYVGKDVAKYIYENDLTFDEYYAMTIASKKD
ncbi:MAG: M15 family metallopeptidase [Bacilli bacterium]|nr:M15 family metallopeptidase [Bacilli bacterium]MDD3304699.1 M15 family metallopeptidase [Bacilli bacterium]MDD4053622.1 M15 family metallopeptidase [Bacilli bacterium]MDD4411121.1 M15 family metallopeptidase [Bacilli bacterium]